jgi:hypothetical protein
MARIAEAEKKLLEIPSTEAYEVRIAELESLLDEQQQRQVKRTALNWVSDIALYLLVPLLMLLVAHWLITVVYDTKMIYLRIVSMVLPLPFAYTLFKGHAHKLMPWFIGVAFLAIASVIGMSWITSLVDHTPVWPQNLFEWKEVLEYSASIAFSFLTGMLLGGVAYAAKQKRRQAGVLASIKKVVVASGDVRAQQGVSVESVHGVLKTLEGYGGTIVALGTTAVSIYTGLKGIVGS